MKISFSTSLKYSSMIILCGMLSFNLFSQGKVGTLIANGGPDAGAIVQAYINPMISGFGAAMNGGWYNTGKPHSLGGFDLTITTNVVRISDEDLTYDLSKLGLSGAFQYNKDSSICPTVMGSSEEGPFINMYGPPPTYDNKIDKFSAPPGIGFRYVPLPIIQGSIGLIKNTEVMLRYLPTIDLSTFVPDIPVKIDFWGVGVKHDIGQWIPVFKNVPIDLSGMFAYNTLKVSFGLDVPVPDTANAIVLPGPRPSGKDQEVILGVNSFTSNLVLSKKIAILTLFASAGFNYSNITLDVKGTYGAAVDKIPGASKTVKFFEDPVSRTFSGATSPRVGVGFRLQLLLLSLHAEYTYASYSVISAGLGISFR